jgi:[acyl-carrier-protein] S-malonyltransferase
MKALMFPGQGSQVVGMGRDLFEAHGTVRGTYEEASAALGYDIAALSFEGPADRLGQTDVTQPALLVNAVAVFRLLAERGLRFDVAFGHSLGEYSALVVTGALPFREAVEIVRRRAEAMLAAARANPGGMAAVLGLDDVRVEELCAGLADVWPANYNSSGQLVVSGSCAGLERLQERALTAGARKVIPLAVSGAFHSPYMAPAAEALGAALEAAPWAAPTPRFFSVCTVDYESAGFASLLQRQVTSPVRFTQSVRRLVADGAVAFLELGPGCVLGGLVRRIAPEAAIAGAGDVDSVEALDEEWFTS